jgi:hypothetical protein
MRNEAREEGRERDREGEQGRERERERVEKWEIDLMLLPALLIDHLL